MKLKNALLIFWLLLGGICLTSALWYLDNYGDLGFNSVLFTVLSGVGGVDFKILGSYVKMVVSRLLFWGAALYFPLIYQGKTRLFLKLRKSDKQYSILPLPRKLRGAVCFLAGLAMVFSAYRMIGLEEWLTALPNTTAIFENEYTAPDAVSVTFPEQKRNLVYIIMESMETSFLSTEQGGSREVCCIPNLYQLAKDNTNFSHSEDVGGWQNIEGTSWTAGSIFAQSSGLPLLTPIGANGGDRLNRALPGATMLWDILAENGYYQAVIMGSEKEFAGQDKLMYQHGIQEIDDYQAGVDDGIVSEDYYEAWGFEDLYTLRYAQQIITRLAQQDQPFAATVITIDTHFPDGDLCELCEQEYTEQYDNVYACADRQIMRFLQWLTEQPFYENTTVVVCGDHLSMDAAYMERNGVSPDVRRVYNCFINAPVQPVQEKNRLFTAMDMFPTTLAALGCEIEGQRLCLGTNLFSDVPTLAEELGYDQLNSELKHGVLPFFRKFMLG